MSLSTEQCEYISQKLREIGIKYQDFFEEIYDHYVTGIEAQMADGVGFEEALQTIDDSFKTYEYNGKRVNQFGEKIQYWGVEALQYEYADKMERQINRRHWQILKSYFRWPTLLTTLLVGILAYALTTELSRKPLVVAVGAMTMLPFVILLGVYGWHWVGFKLSKRSCWSSTKLANAHTRLLPFISSFNLMTFTKNIFDFDVFRDTSNAIFAALFFVYLVVCVSFLQLYREQFVVKIA